MANVCTLITQEIRDLASHFNGETVNSINNLVGIFQERNNTDQYPTVQQLAGLKEELRKEDIKRIENTIGRIDIPEIENPDPLGVIYDNGTRKSRVNLISHMFSDKISSILQQQKIELEKPNISRRDIIESFGPEYIFDLVKQDFLDAKSDDETILEEYRKVAELFDYFKPEVGQILAITEGFIVTGNTISDNVVEDVDEDGNSYLEDAGDSHVKEEEYKDHWMENVLFTNPVSSLSREVRTVLGKIPEIDKNGDIRGDDIGNPIFIDPNQAHKILIRNLYKMTSADDLLPMLNNLKEKYTWVEAVIDELEYDTTGKLISKFYNDFRKDFHEMWVITKEVLPNGRFKFKTVPINRSADSSLVLNEWQSDIESRVQFDNNTIYNDKGELVKSNVDSSLELVNSLKQRLHNVDKIAALNDPSILSDVISAVNRAGINANPAEIKAALQNYEEIDGVSIATPVESLLNNLTTLYQGLAKKPVKANDLISSYKGIYRSIANILQSAKTDSIVDAFREGGKSRYSYVVPSYLGRLINRLKAENNSDFIQKEFQQYDWFYKDGEWLNTALEQIVTDKDVKDKLDYHQLVVADISKGKKEYVDWTSLDYLNIMLSEYFMDGTNPKSGKPFAYYYIPIMADTQSAEFMRLRRYTDNSGERDEFGRNRTYKEQILDGFEKLVLQEFNRMSLVQKRETQILNGSIKPIKNFDITRKSDGTIDSLGGYQFFFLPALNTLKDNNGKLFLDNLIELLNNNSPDLKAFIRDSVYQVIETGFEESYNEMQKLGLLDKNELGELIYLDINGDPRQLINEYYWNSKFATSQIIQLTSTDLAFYKDIDDFQKRFKQIEGKTIKPNVNSVYGKRQQRSIYLKDQDDFVSNAINDITEVLDSRVAKGLLNKAERNLILDKFNNINVTDAQAYISLDGYRSLMDMYGEWDDNVQGVAYNNFMNGSWSYSDFEVLFQPIKPFLYTQNSVKSGVNGSSNIKVPVQHKNAVYLLLSAHDAITNTLGKSAKLRAINQWMQDYVSVTIEQGQEPQLNKGIDIVQFESAVKVGTQGVIDLNNIDSYDDVIKKLNKETTLNDRENTDVVHVIDYEDYGIQVQTPEHTIDTTILDGTQLRALVVSDLPNDTIFNIGNKQFTKSELVHLYNDLLVENTIVQAENVQKIFSNPYRLNIEIQKELLGNPRYSPDLINAVRLKPDGNPVLPYSSPINGNRVQSLLNSIQKNRVIRQKSKGGHYIQVSNYGFTDDLRIEYEGEGNNKRVKYWEVYMPYWSRNIYKQYIKDGELDVNSLPEKLRYMIGYRIPTENKYSMPPLYIKGFLPRSTGDAIMLPADVTAVLGSDFDVDSLYINMYEVDNKGNVIEYDYSKPTEENSLAARNNALLDIKLSILTNPVIAEQSIIPGNYDALKHAAAVASLAQIMSKDELKNILGIKENASLEDIINSLRSLPVKQIDKLAKSKRDKLDPLDPITQLKLHERNMTGAKMIGIVANNKKHHALMQNTELRLGRDSEFILNNKKYTALNAIYTPDNKKIISESLSGFLAASVDNGKDPVMGFMNINGYTINHAMLLSRLGYTPLEITLFLTQPSIIEITNRFNNGERTALNDYISEQLDSTGLTAVEALQQTLEEPFSISYLLENILSNGSTHKNLMTAMLFQYLQKPANDLSRLTRIRVDNRDGGIGPQIANTLINQKRLNDLFLDIEIGNLSLIGADYIIRDLEYKPIRDAKQDIMESKIPYIQGFYTAGIASAKKNMQPYFYQYNQTLDRVHNKIVEDSAVNEIDPVLLNKVFNDYVAYHATKFRFFGKDGDISNEAKRRDMIHNFPKFFNEIVSSDPEVADMPFISSLSPINKKNSPFKTLEFINANQLSENQKADYSKQWASLIYSDKENQRRLGVGLVLYSTFKGGFGFGPSSFISMAPVAVQLATPQYVEVSESVYNNDNPSVEHFTEQFFRNNLDNRKLVEYVSKDYNLNADDEIVISDTTLKEKMPVLIKETIDDYVVAKTYIAIPAKTGYQFYKKTNEADGNRTYYKITPLGIKNTLIEYEYGVPGDVVNSIVENNINEQETVREVQNDENQDLVDPVNEETQLYKQSTTNNLYEENMGDVALGFILGDKKQTPKAKGKMTYSYGNNKRGDLLANTTFDAIKSGERTATTRYVSQGNIEYWGKLNVGDIVEFESASGEKLYVQVTKELTKLESNVNPEEWSKKEGWSVSYFNKNVRPKISEAYQFEYRYISNNETAYQLNLFDNTPERDKTIYDFQPDEEWRDVTGNKIC